MIAAVYTCTENSEQIEIRLDALLLHVIEFVIIGPPDVDLGASHQSQQSSPLSALERL